MNGAIEAAAQGKFRVAAAKNGAERQQFSVSPCNSHRTSEDSSDEI